MKRFIKSSTTATSEMMNWLRSDEVGEMMKTMTGQERRIIGKIANSTDPTTYIGAIADLIGILNPGISDSFDNFMSMAVEVFKA